MRVPKPNRDRYGCQIIVEIGGRCCPKRDAHESNTTEGIQTESAIVEWTPRVVYSPQYWEALFHSKFREKVAASRSRASSLPRSPLGYLIPGRYFECVCQSDCVDCASHKLLVARVSMSSISLCPAVHNFHSAPLARAVCSNLNA